MKRARSWPGSTPSRPEADVNAQKAAVRSAEADSAAAEAGLKAADDNIANAAGHARPLQGRSRTRSHADFERTERLWKNKLVAQQDYDQRKAELEAQVAAVRESETRVAQARGQKQQIVRSTQCHAAPHRRSLKRTCAVSTMSSRSTTSRRRSMAWSPISPCASAKPWSSAFRISPAPPS